MSVHGGGGVADQQSSPYSKTTLAVTVRMIVGIMIVHLGSFLTHVCLFILFYISISFYRLVLDRIIPLFIILLRCSILETRMKFVMPMFNLWFWPRWSAFFACAGYLLLYFVFVLSVKDLFEACVRVQIYIFLLFENTIGVPKGSSISMFLFKENIK